MALDYRENILDKKYSLQLVTEAEVGRTDLRRRIVGKGKWSVLNYARRKHRRLILIYKIFIMYNCVFIMRLLFSNDFN